MLQLSESKSESHIHHDPQKCFWSVLFISDTQINLALREALETQSFNPKKQPDLHLRRRTQNKMSHTPPKPCSTASPFSKLPRHDPHTCNPSVLRAKLREEARGCRNGSCRRVFRRQASHRRALYDAANRSVFIGPGGALFLFRDDSNARH